MVSVPCLTRRNSPKKLLFSSKFEIGKDFEKLYFSLSQFFLRDQDNKIVLLSKT